MMREQRRESVGKRRAGADRHARSSPPSPPPQLCTPSFLTSLILMILFPLSIYAFTLPLPYIAIASSLPRGFISGAAVLVAGLVLYCLTPPQTPSNQ
ncbi:Protein CLT1 [Carex littledalei]|uniref:Protein CLT1 n=1 Tax=Carex littledalei TaxID=544730 RepID=A0A833RL90_9POAL|nr:Protein CLT1 [Carex littledalei]